MLDRRHVLAVLGVQVYRATVSLSPGLHNDLHKPTLNMYVS